MSSADILPGATSSVALTAERRRARRLMPLARLTPFDSEPWQTAEDFVRLAETMIQKGWSPPGDRLESLVPPIPWNRGGRSFVMHVHSWLPLKDILVAHHVTGERRFLDAALGVALDWIAAHRHFTPRARDAGDGTEDGFAWYDQAVGLRLCRLAYVLDAACRCDDIPDETIATLEASLREHIAAISDDKEFRKNTNHGLYQSLGQLSAAMRFADLPDLIPAEFLAQAKARLAMMVRQQYFPEGMHREHSPGYHFATWRALRAGIADGVIAEPKLVAMLAEIEAGLSWLFDGNGRIATIGDTDPWAPPAKSRLGAIADDRLRGVLGREDMAGEAIRGFTQSGYVSVQHFRGARRSFLLQMAGFHSATHKHADHLSFVWTEDQTDILIDPGRWGYRGRTAHNSELFKLGFWYGAPERVFVESAHAHNVVQVDDSEFPRRGVRPFGSGVQAWGEQDGLYFSLCRAPLVDRVVQRRLLVLAPGDFLLVLDLVSDRAPRRLQQWFHLGPGFVAACDGNVMRARNEAGLSVSALPLLDGQTAEPVMAGQSEPFAQGWWCPRAGALEPAPAFAMRCAPAAEARFATLFCLGGEASALPGRVKGDAQDAAAELAWMQDGRRRELSIRISGPDRVAIGTAAGAARPSWLTRWIR